jgi:hypothetical protein
LGERLTSCTTSEEHGVRFATALAFLEFYSVDLIGVDKVKVTAATASETGGSWLTEFL